LFHPADHYAARDDYKHLPTHVVFGLCPTTEADAELLQWELRRYDRLDARQRHAVRSFLEYMRDEKRNYFLDAEEIRDALERYWAREPCCGGAEP
jgi:hypothetical protein